MVTVLRQPAAASGSAPTVGGYATEVLRPLGDDGLELLRPLEIERFVDREALLGAGEIGEPPYWMHVWPGAVALARRLAQETALAGERVLELGCGLALAGVAAARRGGVVTATDWKRDPLLFAAANGAHNGVAIEVAQMDWTHMATRRCFALCMGADVAYDAAAEAALVDALAQAAAPGGRLLLADSVNTYRETIVQRLEESGWETRVDRVLEREEGRNVWVRVIAARRRDI